MTAAGYYGFKMIFAGFACIVHAVFPFIFESSASDCAKEINKAVEQRKALLMVKNARSEDDSDDKRIRSQKQEIQNLKANAKQRAILNAIRAEENRLRALLKDLDPVEREKQVNELIKERIPLLTKQTEEFFISL